MPLLPRTRNRLDEEYLAEKESQFDNWLAEVRTLVGSVPEHMHTLRACKMRLLRIQTGLNEVREGYSDPAA